MLRIHHLGELLALFSAGMTFMTITFAALWVRARERATRAESLLEGMRMGGRGDSMSPALDAIAEEVERIGEGQRFIFTDCGPKGSGLINVYQLDKAEDGASGGWGALYAGYVKKAYTGNAATYPCN